MYVGNGKKLEISNVGLGQLYTHSQSISSITLPNVLHVPNMQKNLINVSQLTKDHDLIAEFDSHSCVIKVKNTGQMLLKGELKDGLYQLNSAFASADSRLSAHSFHPSSFVHSTSSSSYGSFSFQSCKQSAPSSSRLTSALNVNVAQTNNLCKQ